MLTPAEDIEAIAGFSGPNSWGTARLVHREQATLIRSSAQTAPHLEALQVYANVASGVEQILYLGLSNKQTHCQGCVEKRKVHFGYQF